MEITQFNKAKSLNEKIERERTILKRIDKLITANKSKNLSSEDIKYLLDRSHEGCTYILNDLKEKFKNL